MASEALRGPGSNTVQSSIALDSAENLALPLLQQRSIIRRDHLALVPFPVDDLAEAYDDERTVAADEATRIVDQMTKSSDQILESDETPQLKRFAQPEVIGIPQSFYFNRGGFLGSLDAARDTADAGVEFIGDMCKVAVMFTAAEIARTRPARRLNQDIQDLAAKVNRLI